jgi:hypothetical protein
MSRRSKRPLSRFLVALSCCAGAGSAFVACGFSDAPGGGTGGSTSNPTAGASSNPTGGASSNPTAGASSNPTGGASSNPTAGNAGVTSTAGSGTGGGGGDAPMGKGAPNYERTGTWPTQPVKIPTTAGKLTYTKQVIHAEFLAESCSIADYNNDGMPDVSSGRIWYEGPAFTKQHPFRDGHGVLPSAGNGEEIDTGVSDDWSDFPFDVDGDGNTDIINIAQCDVNEIVKTNPKVGTVQPHATAYWYKNPGPAGQAGDPNWQKFLIHQDVRLEQHGLIDMNNDGFPEIYGACKNCEPPTTKGYYHGNPANPTAGWSYQAVTGPVKFPFQGGLGWMHGAGGGDVNGDGLPDLLERSGAWLQQPGGKWSQTECTGKNTPAGCGWVKQNFYDGLPDNEGNKGASHMYAVDMDMDGIPDVVAADWAHGEGLYWYKQGADGKFTKYQFMGGAGAADKTKWKAGFSEPHALQVVDMDGDGRPDIVTGKMRFAHPYGYGDPDPDGVPYLYVFKNVAAADPNSGGPITLQPVLIDPLGNPGQVGTPPGGMGVGRQLAVGHVNTDGIMDICIASKVGLAVFLGQ